jgi:hypothetical protein
MNREKELLERIRQLEELNGILQDKLDMIYSIVAPEDSDEQFEEADDDEEGDEPQGLVQIQLPPKTNAQKVQQIPTNQSPKRV